MHADKPWLGRVIVQANWFFDFQKRQIKKGKVIVRTLYTIFH